jgi:uncharacterized protein
LRVIVFVVVCTLMHLLAACWVLSVSPSARRRPRWVFGLAVGITLGLSILRVIGRYKIVTALHSVLAVGMVELAVLGLSLLPLAIVAVLSRTTTTVLRYVKPATTEAETIARVSRREAIERTVGVTIVGATSLTLGWGALRGRHDFALEEVEIKVPRWPRVLDGYVIAQVSDVHVGAFVGERELGEGFALVRKMRPDLVVATGDLVDVDAAAILPLLEQLLAAGSRDGAYAILGNHDHYAGAARVAAHIRASKVRLLDNEGVRLREGDGGGFTLLGVDDLEGRSRRTSTRAGFHGPDLGRAIGALSPDGPRILLAHQPMYFHESQGRVDLQLSGHTHGGQINPGVSPARAIMEFVAGRYERAGSTLYVNRGFGVSGPPSRIGAAPEITKIVIVSA